MTQNCDSLSRPPPRTLPTCDQWRFADDIQSRLVAEIEECPAPGDLVEAIASSLRSAIGSKTEDLFRQEFVGRCRSGDKRASIAFAVTPALFNQLFNGRNGYRAHFWVDPQTGDAFNRKIIAALRDALAHLPPVVRGQNRNGAKEKLGEAEIQTSFILNSLCLDLAKIWLIEGVQEIDGGIELDDGRSWPLFCYFDRPGEINLKGAYVGEDGRTYQFKHPWCRGCQLHRTGSV